MNQESSDTYETSSPEEIRKPKLIALVVVSSILLLGIGALMLIQISSKPQQVSVEKSGLILTATANNDGDWNYLIKGTLDNSVITEEESLCYVPQVRVSTENSFPVGVIFTLELKAEENSLKGCVYAGSEVELSGKFSADKNILLDMEIAKVAPEGRPLEDLINTSDRVDVVDEITAVSNYVENNKWEYIIAGNKPTPCHEVVVKALVLESFPEQVSLQISFVQENADSVCIQVLEPFEVSGSYNASEQALMELVLNE